MFHQCIKNSKYIRVLLIGTLYKIILQVLNLLLNLNVMFSNVFQVNKYKICCYRLVLVFLNYILMSCYALVGNYHKMSCTSSTSVAMFA